MINKRDERMFEEGFLMGTSQVNQGRIDALIMRLKA